MSEVAKLRTEGPLVLSVVLQETLVGLGGHSRADRHSGRLELGRSGPCEHPARTASEPECCCYRFW